MVSKARWMRITAALAVSAALLLAACGEDEESPPQLVGPPATRTPAPTGSPDAGAASDLVVASVAVESMRVGRGLAWDLHWIAGGLLIDSVTGAWMTDLAGSPALADPELAYLAFSPDGGRVVVRSADGSVTLRDAESGEVVAALDGDLSYFTSAFSADGSRLAVLLGRFPEGVTVITAGAAPESWGVQEGRVREVDAATGETLAEYEAPEARVLGLTYTPDGVLLLAGASSNLLQFSPDYLGAAPEVNAESADLDLRLWDLAAGEPVTTITDTEGAMMQVAFSPDGSRLVGMSTKIDQGTFVTLTDTLTAVWNLPGGERAHTFDLDRQDRVSLLAISPDGSRLAMAVNGQGSRTTGTPAVVGRVDVFDLATGELLRSLAADPLQTGFGEAFRALAFDPTGERLAALAINGTVVVWDVAGGDVLHTLDAFNSAIGGLAYSQDGAILASAAMDGAIRVWDAASGERQTTIYTSFPPMNLVFDPAGLLVGQVRGSALVLRWDPATGEMLGGPIGQNFSAFLALAFDPSGERAATSTGGGTVSIRDLETGEQDVILAPHQVSVLAFSPDGSRLLTGGMDGSILLWDLADRNTPLARLDGHTGAVTDLHFVDAETVLSASRHPVMSSAQNYEVAARYTAPDRTLRRWDLAGAAGGGSIQPLQTVPLPGPDLPPTDQALSMGLDPALMGGVLSPDFAWLAMIDPDEGQTIVVYDIASGAEIAALDAHEARVTALAFAPDGARLASGDQDGLIVQWQFEAVE